MDEDVVEYKQKLERSLIYSLISKIQGEEGDTCGDTIGI